MLHYLGLPVGRDMDAGERGEAGRLLGDALASGGEAARAEAGNYPLLEELLAEIRGSA